MSETTTQHPTVEVTVAAPIDTIWGYVRDPALIRRWHGWTYEGDGLDAEIRLIYVEHATEADDPYVVDLDGGDRIELTPVGDSETVVTITRRSLDAAAGSESSYDEITEGWRTFLSQLRFAVEQQPSEERRTIHLSGGDGSLRDKVGVDGPAGERYAVALGDGLDLEGMVWMRSAFQLGLTVESLGPGLVMVTDAPDASMVIVTTYRQSDVEFAATTERWAAWFRGYAPDAEGPTT
jgi:hypothetical protein